MIRIDYEIGKVNQKLGSYKKKTPLVISRALNRAIQNAKTNADREVRKGYHLKSKDVKSTFTLRKANKNNLAAKAISKGGLLGLEKFKVSPSKPRPGNPPKTLKIAIKKDGLKPFQGGFMADIKGLKVFKRVNSSRLPIKRLVGPAIPQLMKNTDLRKRVQDEAVNTYNKRLKHEINRVLESGKK